MQRFSKIKLNLQGRLNLFFYIRQHLQESDELVLVGRANLVHPVDEDCDVPRLVKGSLEEPLRGLSRTRRRSRDTGRRDTGRRSQQLHQVLLRQVCDARNRERAYWFK
ncbi:Protein of unknown function [Gryllus bimaculatus]|nr:Protein of unknown function [Gryllus bimaculatus]